MPETTPETTSETAPGAAVADTGDAVAATDHAIRLDHVNKRFPGAAEDAVGDLSFDIPAGEIVVLIGPSGCGKTTTLRMINRMEEPTGGHIYVNDRDVMSVDAVELRRHIGYVIQQIGLFPHMSIADNIGLIPKVLGWKPPAIRSRVDELLDLVGLEPQRYRGRYPKELSGGQQQRVGVARALAADPPIMLMDEPFGAIDPITRERLQEEFVRLQQQIRKTIVFVTHDIREAMTLGDRIALLDVGGVLAQYDTPERMLTNPNNEFVSDFIGEGKEVRRLDLTLVGEVPLEPLSVLRDGEGVAAGGGRAVVLGPDGRPHRWSDGGAGGDLAVVETERSLYHALDVLLAARQETAVVVDGQGEVVGSLTWSAVLRGLPSEQDEPVGPQGRVTP